jgi:hypothetical protein
VPILSDRPRPGNRPTVQAAASGPASARTPGNARAQRAAQPAGEHAPLRVREQVVTAQHSRPLLPSAAQVGADTFNMPQPRNRRSASASARSHAAVAAVPFRERERSAWSPGYSDAKQPSEASQERYVAAAYVSSRCPFSASRIPASRSCTSRSSCARRASSASDVAKRAAAILILSSFRRCVVICQLDHCRESVPLRVLQPAQAPP